MIQSTSVHSSEEDSAGVRTTESAMTNSSKCLTISRMFSVKPQASRISQNINVAVVKDLLS